MPSFTGKTFSTFYKNILALANNSYTGMGTSGVRVTDAEGNGSAIMLSDDVVHIFPNNDNTVNTLSVGNAALNEIFAVDTTNSKVKIGTTGTAANTQYAHFGIDNTVSSLWADDTHYAVPFQTNFSAGSTAVSMGTATSSSFNDTNPATTLTITNTAMSVVQHYWYVMDDITIDAVKWFHAADTATGEDVAAHLMSYTVDTANGSTGGDLSSGTVLADGATITNAVYEQIYYQGMTIQSANVDAGKVIIFTFAQDAENSDYSVNATVKYHIR